MKNIFKPILCAAACVAALHATAQTDPSRETVLINPFTYTGAVNQAATDNIRSAVMTGFSDRGRFNVIDVMTDATLSKLVAQRGEDNVTAANWQENSEAFKATQARTIIIGQANNIANSQERSESGKITYWTEVTFSLKVYSIADGSQIGAEDFAVKECDFDSYDGAFNSAMASIRKKMVGFIETNYPIITYILEAAETDKKGNIKTLYISGGSEVGISKGLVFEVFTEKKIGPKTIQTKIGKLVANQIMDGATLCKVSEGAPAIKEKLANGETLTVKSLKQRPKIWDVVDSI